MSTPVLTPPTRPTAPPTTKLRRFLEAYWLRPENALWMTLRSDALAANALTPPSLDLGCGDGLFLFLHGGGLLDPAFDVFSCVADAAPATSPAADMFDCIRDEYCPTVLQAPRLRIDVGTDHKSSLLEKARRLRLHGRLVLHDHERTPLPFADDTFETIYSNCTYWIHKIDAFLKDVARVVHPGGRVLLQVKLDSIKRYTLAPFRHQLGDRFLRLIDRGRIDSWPSLADRQTWERRFVRAGFIIQEAVPFVTRTHAHLWDIGLRPIAPLLTRMANELNPQSRESIKCDWVDLFCALLEPLCKPDFDLGGGDCEPVELHYVLTRQ